MAQTDQLTAYFNGEMVPLSALRLSIFDFLAVYEMTRTFAGQPFLLDRHLQRLELSARLSGVDCGHSLAEIEALSLQVVAANLPALDDGEDMFLRHDITRGPMRHYAQYVPEYEGSALIVSATPLTTYLGRVAAAHDTGLHAVIPSQQAIPSRYLDPKAKTRCRTHYLNANMQAERIEHGAWAVMLDEHGFLTEGTSSNFAIVREGVIYTPERRNVLRGVSMGYVAELARDLGLGFVEKNLEPYDVLAADEAFFTASSYCLVPVSQFEFRPVGEGRPGPVVKSLLAEWSHRVGVDIVAQARRMAEKYG